MSCPCGSDKAFDVCCGPYLAGTQQPPTAEALMRARYSAFVKGDVDFIVDTHAAETRSGVDRRTIETWSKQSEWRGLEILATRGGGPTDDVGEVEFVARYRLGEEEHDHHEHATFAREGGRWFFVDGTTPSPEPFRRTAAKTGRNDPCPCGSGKKFKKCCGAAAVEP